MKENLKTVDYILSFVLLVSALVHGLFLFNFDAIAWLVNTTSPLASKIVYGLMLGTFVWVVGRLSMGKFMK